MSFHEIRILPRDDRETDLFAPIDNGRDSGLRLLPEEEDPSLLDAEFEQRVDWLSLI